MKIHKQKGEHACKCTELSLKRKLAIVILVLFVYIWTIEIVCVLLCLTHHITRIVSHILEHVYVDSMFRMC